LPEFRFLGAIRISVVAGLGALRRNAAEPFECRGRGIEHRDVPVPGGEPQLVKREAPREPLRASGGHDAVTAAVDEQHGGVGLGRVEAPGVT
jgi:hypothetical protein